MILLGVSTSLTRWPLFPGLTGIAYSRLRDRQTSGQWRGQGLVEEKSAGALVTCKYGSTYPSEIRYVGLMACSR